MTKPTRAERLQAARLHAREHLEGVMDEMKSEALEMRAIGTPKNIIAAALNVSRPTVDKWLKGDTQE